MVVMEGYVCFVKVYLELFCMMFLFEYCDFKDEVVQVVVWNSYDVLWGILEGFVWDKVDIEDGQW